MSEESERERILREERERNKREAESEQEIVDRQRGKKKDK